MKLRTTLAAVAASTMVASSAMAGGFLAAETTPPVIEIAPAPAPAGFSLLPGWVIPAVVVAALVGVAVASDDS